MPTISGKPNLKDVALSAGVSVPTVSRILNNRTKGFSVRPEVRDRVRQAARTLSYRPHLMAQSLRKRSMGIVGLLGMHMPTILPEDAVRGLVEVFEQQGIKLSTYIASSIRSSHELPPWKIDGAVIAGVLSPEDVKPLERARLPYVSINGWTGPHGGSVNFDDAAGMEQALDHLIRLGHRRIAYANARGPWRTHPSVEIRHTTYLQVLAREGLPPIDGHDRPWTEEEAQPTLRRWIESDRVTAVVAYQHYHALELMRAAYELGYTPPGRLSIVCFNDEYIGRMCYPALTAIALPSEASGRTAAEMLLGVLGKPLLAPQPVVLRPTLFVRESTAPPIDNR